MIHLEDRNPKYDMIISKTSELVNFQVVITAQELISQCLLQVASEYYD